MPVMHRVVASTNRISIRDFLPGVLPQTTITISGGEITPTRGSHIIAAESGTADDCDTINFEEVPTSGYGGATPHNNGNSLRAGDVIELTPDTGDTITFTSGVGNITTDTGASLVAIAGQTVRFKVNAAGTGVVASLITNSLSAAIPQSVPASGIGGTGDAITVTISGGPALADGLTLSLIPGAANTGAVTVNYNGGGALALVDGADAALDADALSTTAPIVIRYTSTGTKWRIVGAGVDEDAVNALIDVKTREKLTANRTYYVDPGAGSDSNTGLSSGAAFQTIAKAVAVCTSDLDFNGYTVTIQFYSASLPVTFTERIVMEHEGMMVGQTRPHQLVFRGDPDNRSNYKFTGPGDYSSVFIRGGKCVLEGIEVSSTGSGGLQLLERARVIIKSIHIGACASAKIQVADAYCRPEAAWSTGGNSTALIVSEVDGGHFDFGSQQFTHTANAEYSLAAINCGEGATVSIHGMRASENDAWQYSGGVTVTGTKYIITGGYVGGNDPGLVSDLAEIPGSASTGYVRWGALNYIDTHLTIGTDEQSSTLNAAPLTVIGAGGPDDIATQGNMQLAIYNNGIAAGISIVSNESGDCIIYMGDSADPAAGRLQFANSQSEFYLISGSSYNIISRNDGRIEFLGSGASLRMIERSAPSTPAANSGTIYFDSADGGLKVKFDSGNVAVIAAAV